MPQIKFIFSVITLSQFSAYLQKRTDLLTHIYKAINSVAPAERPGVMAEPGRNSHNSQQKPDIKGTNQQINTQQQHDSHNSALQTRLVDIEMILKNVNLETKDLKTIQSLKTKLAEAIERLSTDQHPDPVTKAYDTTSPSGSTSTTSTTSSERSTTTEESNVSTPVSGQDTFLKHGLNTPRLKRSRSSTTLAGAFYKPHSKIPKTDTKPRPNSAPTIL